MHKSTLHKSQNSRIEHIPLKVPNVKHALQADSTDVNTIAKANNGIKFPFTAVDVYSSKGYAVKVKNSSMTT